MNWVTSRPTVVFAACAALFQSAIAADLELYKKPALTLEIAKEIMQACFDRQKKKEATPVSIAIYDVDGNLILFQRMTGATRASAMIAMKKAESAASFGLSTRQWGEISKAELINTTGIPKLIMVAGGLPIYSQDKHLLGGVGVSGLSPEDDENCAQAGLDMVKSVQ